MNGNENNHLLCEEASRGHIDDVARLVQLCDARWFNNAALRAAARMGHTRCVELLIPHSSVQDHNSWALREASANGHYECVKLLMAVSDPNDFPVILENVARVGCRKSVTFVLQQVSNVQNVTAALKIAAIHNHYDCVDILYPHADVGAALDCLIHSYAHHQKFWQPLQDRYNAEQQKTSLECAVGAVEHTFRVSKL